MAEKKRRANFTQIISGTEPKNPKTPPPPRKKKDNQADALTSAIDTIGE